MAQLHELPAIIRDFSDNEVLEVAIIENIQRADLNPLEEAAGYRQLMDRFGRTQEQMAEALGKSRSHIANLLRLLGLPTDVQAHLKEGRLTIDMHERRSRLKRKRAGSNYNIERSIRQGYRKIS